MEEGIGPEKISCSLEGDVGMMESFCSTRSGLARRDQSGSFFIYGAGMILPGGRPGSRGECLEHQGRKEETPCC